MEFPESGTINTPKTMTIGLIDILCGEPSCHFPPTAPQGFFCGLPVLFDF